MAKKKNPAGVSGGAGAPPERPTTEEGEEPTGKRLGLQLDAEGRIEWDRLRARTRDELKVALADPRVRAELGVDLGPSSGSGEKVSTDTVGMLYGAIGGLLVMGAQAMGYTPESAAGLQFTSEERAALLDPTTRVLEKYSFTLGKWEDEIMLSFALGTMLFAKSQGLKRRGKVIAMAPKPAETPMDPINPDPPNVSM